MINMLWVKLALSSIFFFNVFPAWGQTEKLQDEKELEMVDFKSIKKVLQQDGLSQSAVKKTKQVEAIKEEQKHIDVSRYEYPTEDDFWGFVSEYWLVKNAQLLGWDFEKPDYGIDSSFRTMLQTLGFFQKKFKVLMLNSPNVPRCALPGFQGEKIFLLSVPFIRSLDLSRMEISLLLLEDYFRLEADYFKKAVITEKMKTHAGTNFYGKEPDRSIIQELMSKYDNQINKKGYSFQQQFEITKKMDVFLKVNPELWNAYYRLMGKLDRFLKSNQQYKDYIKLYPSPEMQMKWLSPEEKVL
jgi:hypothetical protein